MLGGSIEMHLTCMPAGMKGLKIWFSGDCGCVKAFSSTGEAWDQIDSDYSSLTLQTSFYMFIHLEVFLQQYTEDG